MPTLQSDSHENQRRRIAKHVEEFLAKGGQIHQVQPEDCRWYKDQAKKRKPHVPMMINTERNAERLERYHQRMQRQGQPGVPRAVLTPEHPWIEDNMGYVPKTGEAK